MSDTASYRVARGSTGAAPPAAEDVRADPALATFEDYEFISPSDKPALLALSSLETLANVQTICLELGYKVHVASNHEDFFKRFFAMNYQLVLVEELFAADNAADNAVLLSLQTMAMAKRRHATIILIGEAVQTMNPMQAFQQSMHAVVNRNDLSSLGQIIAKTTADNDQFLHTYREVQEAQARGELR